MTIDRIEAKELVERAKAKGLIGKQPPKPKESTLPHITHATIEALAVREILADIDRLRDRLVGLLTSASIRLMDLGTAQLSTLERATDVAAEFYGLDRRALMGRDRHQPVAEARQLAMFLAHQANPMLTYVAIGAHFNRDHGTVMWGVRRIQQIIDIVPLGHLAKSIPAMIEQVRGES